MWIIETHTQPRESSTRILFIHYRVYLMLSVLSERIEISVYCFLGDAVCDKIYYDPYFLSHTIPRAWFLLLAPARCSQYVTGCFMSSAVHRVHTSYGSNMLCIYSVHDLSIHTAEYTTAVVQYLLSVRRGVQNLQRPLLSFRLKASTLFSHFRSVLLISVL